ncbi:MAG: histidinol-phosphate transaminase [Ethanoligenens sp.]
MNLVSEKLARLKPYDPETATNGIHLDANESFVPLSDNLREEIGRRVSALEFNRYPDPLGRAVCEAFGGYYGVDARYVTLGNGSDELITLLFNVLLEKGDRALLVTPDFSMYQQYCALGENEPIILPKDSALQFDADALIQLARDRQVRMVLFSNPCNPTSQGIPATDVLKIIDSLDCLVVVDEAYMDFWDEAVIREAPKRENCIVLKTLSKVGFASIRLGFAVANDRLSAYLRVAKSPYNVNALTQTVGEIILTEKHSLQSATAQIQASRDLLYTTLLPLVRDGLRVFPAHANFVTLRSPQASGLHEELLARGVSVRCIGGELLRVTAGAPEENQAFIQALSACLKEGVHA